MPLSLRSAALPIQAAAYHSAANPGMMDILLNCRCLVGRCLAHPGALAKRKSGKATRGGKAGNRRRKHNRRSGDKFPASHRGNLRSSLIG